MKCVMRYFLICLMLTLLLPVFPVQARRRPSAGVKTTEINEHFHKLFVHDYVNMLVFTGDEGVLLVDTGMDPVGPVQEAVKAVSDRPVKYIVSTHLNGDHVLGNAAFGPDVKIVSSRICRNQLASDEAFPRAGIPNISFDREMTLHFNGEEIRLIFTPGHTGGDITAWFVKANIACLGDLIFPDSFPGIQERNGGDVEDLERSIARLIEILPGDILIVNGHDRDYSMDDLKAYYEMIIQTRAAVASLEDKGMTPDQIRESEPLLGWKAWDSAFFPGEITRKTWLESLLSGCSQDTEKRL